MKGTIIFNNVKNLRPVFTGLTKEAEEISLYAHIDKLEEIYILLPNGELCALSPGSEVSTWYDSTTCNMRVDIISKEWTGQASGNTWDIMRTDAI